MPSSYSGFDVVGRYSCGFCVCAHEIHPVGESTGVYFTMTLRNPMAKFLSISRASRVAGTFGR